MANTYGPKLGKLINANIGDPYPNDFRPLLRAFDALIQGSVLDTSVVTPPLSPNNGDAYILLAASSPTGAWAGNNGQVAVWSTEITTPNTDTKVPGWDFYVPNAGWVFFSVAQGNLWMFTGTEWYPLAAATPTGLQANVVNAQTGFQVNGSAASGNVLRGNGTDFVSSQLSYNDLSGQLGTFTAVDNGLVPASGGGTVNFLRADGSWQTPAGAGQTTIWTGAGAPSAYGANVSLAQSAWNHGTASLAFPNHVVTGNIMVVVLANSLADISVVTLSDTLSTVWTRITYVNTFGANTAMWMGIVPSPGGANTITMSTGAGNSNFFSIAEFSGVTAVVDTFGQGTYNPGAGSAGLTAAATLSLTQAGDLVLGTSYMFASSPLGNIPNNPPNTVQVNNNSGDGIFTWGVAAVTGNYNASIFEWGSPINDSSYIFAALKTPLVTNFSGGANGDFYFDTTNSVLYGPKAAGAWPQFGHTIPGTAVLPNSVLAGPLNSDGLSAPASFRPLVPNDIPSGITYAASTNYTFSAYDNGRMVVFSFGNITSAATLPNPATLPVGWFCYVSYFGSNSSGTLTITSPSGHYINVFGEQSIELFGGNNGFGQGFVLCTDGTNYYTMLGVGLQYLTLSVPSEFSVSGSPAQSPQGALSFSKASQSANYVWAGPSSGSAAQPTFRTLVPQDINLGTHDQAVTIYTVLSTDNGKLLTFTSSSSVAVTLPHATTLPSGFNCAVSNLGTGTVTLTPTTSTIDNLTSLNLTQYQGLMLYSTGSNYETVRGAATGNVGSAGGASVVGNVAQLSNTSTTQISDSGISVVSLNGFKNRLIDGNFSIIQRGTGPFNNVAGTAVYGLDRWFFFRQGLAASNIMTMSQVAGQTARYAMHIQRTAGDTSTAYMRTCQIMETSNTWELQGKNVTVSGLVRMGANFSGGSLNITLRGSNTTDDTSAAAAGGGFTYLNATSVAATTSQVPFSFTTAVPSPGSNFSTTLMVFFEQDPTGTAGANDWFEVENVQLEVGSVATPFERRSIGTEQDLCQRYYYRWSPTVIGYAMVGHGMATSATQVWINCIMPTNLRTTPFSYNGVDFVNLVNMSLLGSSSSVYGNAGAQFPTGSAPLLVEGTSTVTLVFNPAGGGMTPNAPYVLYNTNEVPGAAYVEFCAEM